METIWELFAAAATRFAQRAAVVDGELRWSYEDLARASRRLAGTLQARGLGPGDRVAILERNAAGYLAAYFAAAGCGAVLVPLNRRLAAPELRAVLADAGATLLLAGAEDAARAADLAARGGPDWLTPEAAWSDAAGAGFAPVPRRPEDVAQLYYTSGTTGAPKGVVLTHRNVCRHALAAVEELGLGAEDRWGHAAPLFHLADAWATFAITHVGGLHVVAPRFEPAAVLALFARERVTVTNLVPTMWTALVGLPEAGRDSSLRLALSGGAPITATLVRRVIATFRCEYVQTYGMTETSPYLTLGLLNERLRRLPPEEQLAHRARTGRPFRGVTLEVVDADGRPVPADDRSVGEIRVRGATVSPGYWNRPEETAAAFRGGWLYTGDLAVVDAEGYVDIVDRKKDMIVTGGENVYCAEVENALAAAPGVREVAVYGVPDATWGEAVCAAVVPEGEPDPEALRAFCRERLAGYKVPRRIRFVEELPKTGSGKVSKRALRSQATGAPSASDGSDFG